MQREEKYVWGLMVPTLVGSILVPGYYLGRAVEKPVAKFVTNVQVASAKEELDRLTALEKSGNKTDSYWATVSYNANSHYVSKRELHTTSIQSLKSEQIKYINDAQGSGVLSIGSGIVVGAALSASIVWVYFRDNANDVIDRIMNGVPDYLANKEEKFIDWIKNRGNRKSAPDTL